MGDRLPRMTAKQITTVLEKRGFCLVRQSGIHMIYRNMLGKGTTIPFHGATILHPKLLKSIIRDTDLSMDDLFGLL